MSTKAPGNANGVKVWADYLFSVLDDAPEDIEFPISDDNIRRIMVSSGHEDVVVMTHFLCDMIGDVYKQSM